MLLVPRLAGGRHNPAAPLQTTSYCWKPSSFRFRTTNTHVRTPACLQHVTIRSAVRVKKETPQREVVRVGDTDFILGLDVNSQSTGYALLDKQGQFLKGGWINLKDGDTIYDKAKIVKSAVLSLYSEFDPNRQAKWVVGVEEFLKGFGGGGWNSNDLYKLAQINSLVSYDCIHIFNANPRRIHVTSARTYFGLKRSEAKNDVKAVVLDYVSKILPEYPWTRAKTGKLHMQNYDISDAYIVAAYTYHHPAHPAPRMSPKEKRRLLKQQAKEEEKQRLANEKAMALAGHAQVEGAAVVKKTRKKRTKAAEAVGSTPTTNLTSPSSPWSPSTPSAVPPTIFAQQSTVPPTPLTSPSPLPPTATVVSSFKTHSINTPPPTLTQIPIATATTSSTTSPNSAATPATTTPTPTTSVTKEKQIRRRVNKTVDSINSTAATSVVSSSSPSTNTTVASAPATTTVLPTGSQTFPTPTPTTTIPATATVTATPIAPPAPSVTEKKLRKPKTAAIKETATPQTTTTAPAATATPIATTPNPLPTTTTVLSTSSPALSTTTPVTLTTTTKKTRKIKAAASTSSTVQQQ